MKTSVTSVAFVLTVAGMGMGWHVHAGQHKVLPAKASLTGPAAIAAEANVADANLMVALGDEFVGNCSVQHNGCSKAWHELDTIAAKEKL